MVEAFEFKVRVVLNWRMDNRDIILWDVINDIKREIESLSKKIPEVREISVMKICFGLEIEP